MKYFVYLLSIIVIFALMGLFFIKQPNGNTWLSLDDFSGNTSISHELSAIYNDVVLTYNNVISQDKVEAKVYRWQDNNGNWSYSDKPTALIESEVVELDTNDIVVIPAFKDAIDEIKKLNTIENSMKVTKSTKESINTSASNVTELHNNAKNIQKLMDDRQFKMAEAIKNSN